ncbi:MULTISPECIES: glycosyltransferase family 2 protein [Flavobacterium]|uniref:glycosyltransferase family 2 protein n=1 Tax=Flavobacterium TaxID=237 RepID=UPI001182839D|nr:MULTISPECIES: glycosyltransferase family 2 protein [Flavobacterium]MCR4030939.1 glycosyltransferase family 2 protein [Flavobacterium panacis]
MFNTDEQSVNNIIYQIPGIKVSVIIPNYNHEPYLEQRIESVLKQSFQDFELLILDDCSTDNSKEIISSYKENQKVSHIFYNQINSGTPFGLWQYGIEKAKGKYIWIAESDDWADEDFLSTLVAVLEKTDAVVAHSNSMFFINNKLKLNDWWDTFSNSRWESNYLEKGSILLEEYGKYKCPVINVSSAVFRKDILKEEYYPVNFRYSGDWWFWINVFMAGNVAFIAKALNKVRVHKLSVTQNSNAVNINKLREDIKVVNFASQKLNAKLTYSQNYEWLLSFWLLIFQNKGGYFNKMNHFLDLPFSFKKIFYQRYFSLLWKKAIKKTIF